MYFSVLKISTAVIISATIFDLVSSKSFLDQFLARNFDELENSYPADRNKVWTSGNVGSRWASLFPSKTNDENNSRWMSSKVSRNMNSKGGESGGAKNAQATTMMNDQGQSSGSDMTEKHSSGSQSSGGDMTDKPTSGSQSSGSDMTEKHSSGSQSSGGDMTEKTSTGSQSGSDSKKSSSGGQSNNEQMTQSSGKIQDGETPKLSSAVITPSKSASKADSTQSSSGWHNDDTTVKSNSESQESNSKQKDSSSTSKIATLQIVTTRSSFKQKIDRFFQKWNFWKSYQEGESSYGSDLNEIIFE